MVSKKINRKNINHEGLEDLKIKFYSYMIYYHNHENNYHDVSKCYRVIYDTYT
jgi:26S proteasome regulatory subunit N5